jgi:hypothetical protein
MQTQTKQTRPFKMLIGDDSYTDRSKTNNALSLILCGMAEVTGTGSILEGEFLNATDYVTPEFPIPGFNGAEIKAVSSVAEMVREASADYDFIATDMDYGDGYETGGRDVLRDPTVRRNLAKKVIFTSEDNPRVLEELVNMGADIVISPTLMKSRELKVTLLGRAIAEYYQAKTAGGNL